jgi:hypothetical protein
MAVVTMNVIQEALQNIIQMHEGVGILLHSPKQHCVLTAIKIKEL